MQMWVAGALLTGALCAGAAGAGAEVPRAVPFTAVRLNDSFWAPKLKVYRERSIPNSWQYVQREIEDNEIAAGLRQIERGNDTPWNQANLHKVLETCGYALGEEPNPELDAKLTGIISAIRGARQPDGYCNALITVRKIKPWSWLDGRHEGYVAGHLIEAAVAHYQATGRTDFLDVARGVADNIYQVFITDGKPGVCGHAELELALVRLYRVTGEKRYLDLAKDWIERRGKKWAYDSETVRAYFMDHLPIRDVQEVTGHAVRTMFYLTGVADVAAETGDAGLADAARRLFIDTTQRRMYVSGSVGTQEKDEGFGPAYELPNEGGYGESCAACGMVYYAEAMFRLDRDAGAADVMERVLYNAALHGIALDGCSTYYRNALHDQNHLRDNCWVCCPPCLSRTLLRVPDYVYATAGRDLWVNLYAAGEATATVAGRKVKLSQITGYPWDGQITLDVDPGAQPAAMALRLRLPGWAPSFALRLNGQAVGQPRREKGYLVLDREWRAGDRVELDLPMPVQRIAAHPKVVSNAGRVALMRGPILYGLESQDNPTVEPRLGADPGFRAEWRGDLLGGVTAIRFRSADATDHLAIPYHAMANRGNATQRVWLAQNDMPTDTAGWDGLLYRPWSPAAR